MLATIERRFERLQGRWNQFIGESDERDSARFLRVGCDPDKPWQEWPPKALALLEELGMDPAEIHAALRVVVDRRADRDIIRIIWLDRGELAGMETPPLVAVQPGYLDLLRPDHEPRVTTLPMNPESRRKFGDDPPTLVVSYTDKTPRNAPAPAQGASMPVTAPERPQRPPQAEKPYSFEEARRTTLALARRQDRANRRRIR